MRNVGRAFLLVILLLVPGLSRAGAPEDDALRLTMLRGHNDERARWGFPSLRWDEDLALGARRHATALASSGTLRHGVITGPKAPGENLWMGTHGAYAYADMVDAFLRERRLYVAGAMPQISLTGRWTDTGHYSQIIWRATTAVGCGFAEGPDYDVLVCRYDPAGNILGQRADGSEPRQTATAQKVVLAGLGQPAGF